MKTILFSTQHPVPSIFLSISLSLLISFSGGQTFAESNKVDSLLTELKKATHDTTKVNIYNNLFLEYEFTDTSKAKKYVQLALELSKKNNYKEGLAASYTNLGSFNEAQCNYKKVIEYYKKSLKLYEELGDKKGISMCYNNIGLIHWNQGNYYKALEYFQKSLKIIEELGDRKSMSSNYINIGVIHHLQDNYPKALKYLQKSLKIKEELGDRKGMSLCYNNIGAIHDEQGNYPKALEYFQKSLKIDEELGDRKGISDSYNNIGVIHYYQRNYPKALEYYQKSLKIREELGDRKDMSGSYNNIGSIHYEQGNYPKALEYLQKSLKIKEELGDRQGIAMTIGNIAGLNIKLKNYTKAIEQVNKGLNIAKEIGALYLERAAYGNLFTAYDSLRNYKKAYYFHKLYKQANDSLFNEEKNEKLTEMETRYQSEKKEQQLKLKDTQIAKQNAEIRQKNTQLIAFIGGFVLLLVLALIIFRSYRQQKKQKAVIALKNKDITDSINYAVRIQQAILPSEDFTNEILSEHFILFKPKDIVSGDFYWAARIKNWLIVAAVDCTGHGVPGAFMSMLGVAFLNEIVTKEEVTQANQVLNELRENIISSLQQKGIEGEAKDGMDMSLIVIDTETNKLQFAGANNPLYIIRNNEKSPLKKGGALAGGSQVYPVGKNDRIGGDVSPLYIISNNEKSPLIKGGALAGGSQGDVSPKTKNLSGFGEPDSVSNEKHILYEVKGDKMPIGIHEVMKEFTNNELQLQKGDTLYIFSDGYPDQFGGEKGKKFKYKPFKESFLSIQAQTMEEQKEILAQTFEDWKGDLEQLDDVVVIGIRI